MRPYIFAALLLTGCATAPVPQPATGNALAGMWRASSGQTLSISLFSSFATQHGCSVTGGMLEPLGDGLYRISRYDTGFASDECGQWRNSPEIAPFDGAQVRLERRSDQLIASGPRRHITFRWIGRSPV